MIFYFGTSLDSYGHYFFNVEENRLNKYDCKINFGNIPFDPEKLPLQKEKGRYNENGYVKFYSIEGYSICAITGSCIDHRPGSKSVFFVKAIISDEELKDLILGIPIAKKMIDKMSFEVMW
jgi:hypothetical protein